MLRISNSPNRGGKVPIISREQLPWSEIAHELVGAEHELAITLLFVDAEPGRGPALHRHPYAEVIVVQEGQADFTLNGERLQARPGDIVIVPPNQAHAFVNSGDEPLRQIDIHLSPSFSTEWLGDR
jgi:quercetin dioxygenase-like cupin family protein